MADEPDSKSSSSTAWTGAMILLLPMLYVLSIGPMAFLTNASSGHSSLQSQIRSFYRPVIWLHDNTSLKTPLERYVRIRHF